MALFGASRSMRMLFPAFIALTLAAALGLSAQPAHSSPPAVPPVCIAYGVDQCVAQVEGELALLESEAETNLANAGDQADGAVPAYEACWESAMDPLYNALESGSSAALAGLSGCDYSGNGGTTVYYPKGYMTANYAHAGNFNHKLSNWLHNYQCTDYCYGYFETYLTNSENHVYSGYTYSGNNGANGFIGADFNRIAARPYCEYLIDQTPGPKQLVECYYQYG
jgi:hypothetical protein